MTQTFIAYKATIKLRISLLPMSQRKYESSKGRLAHFNMWKLSATSASEPTA